MITEDTDDNICDDGAELVVNIGDNGTYDIGDNGTYDIGDNGTYDIGSCQLPRWHDKTVDDTDELIINGLSYSRLEIDKHKTQHVNSLLDRIRLISSMDLYEYTNTYIINNLINNNNNNNIIDTHLKSSDDNSSLHVDIINNNINNNINNISRNNDISRNEQQQLHDNNHHNLHAVQCGGPVDVQTEWYPPRHYEGSYTESYFHGEDIELLDNRHSIPNYMTRLRGRSILPVSLSQTLKIHCGYRPIDYFTNPDMLTHSRDIGRLRGRLWVEPTDDGMLRPLYVRRFDKKKRLGFKRVTPSVASIEELYGSDNHKVVESGSPERRDTEGLLETPHDITWGTLEVLRSEWHSRHERGSHSYEQQYMGMSFITETMLSEGPHYSGKVGEILSERYIIRGVLGTGTFGRVFDCWDTVGRKSVALKVVRANGTGSGGGEALNMIAAAKEETRALREVGIRNSEQYKEFRQHTRSIITLLNHFSITHTHTVWKNTPTNTTTSNNGGVDRETGRSLENSIDDKTNISDEKLNTSTWYEVEMTHFVMVFERVGCSVAHYINKNSSGRGMHIVDTWKVARDIINGLEFLHRINMVHGDLKLQNIAFVQPDFRLCPHPRRFVCTDTHTRVLYDAAKASVASKEEADVQVYATRRVLSLRPRNCNVKSIFLLI
eukprot:GHVR01076274.1.p1 GENE.GHVR01076274.1~~GHVR01076274.1.p1  ORF type:complete len:663 (+),score=187.86 GHVR01076274.1:199-2187(+)